MQPSDTPTDFTQFDDPAFLHERARVRRLLEHEPDDSTGHAELERRYVALTQEFLHRARIAWSPDTWEASP